MNILICKQGLFGGTDKLLDRLYRWLVEEGRPVDSICLTEDGLGKLKRVYDLVVLPSSQMGDIFLLIKYGIEIKRLLVWIMGMGAFSDSYYTYPSNRVVDKLLYRMYQKEAVDTLKWLIKNNAIIFTDGVGVYNTVKKSCESSVEDLEKNIVPIAIDCPDENLWKKRICDKHNQTIRISWVGRVSNDFKAIPIVHLIDDIESYLTHENLRVELTIVGDGDAISLIKEKALTMSFPIDFINNIPYEELNEYFSDRVDLLIAMGTSALDGAKIGCPTVVITPVRPNDPERVEYRWIYDSVGYSLGEFPDIDIETGQLRVSFETIMNEYSWDGRISDECFKYSHKFDMNIVFRTLLERELPGRIDIEMIKHLKKFLKMKVRKSFVKRIMKW